MQWVAVGARGECNYDEPSRLYTVPCRYGRWTDGTRGYSSWDGRADEWGGERKKPPPSESRRGYRSISVSGSVRGCACVCVFFSTVSCFYPSSIFTRRPLAATTTNSVWTVIFIYLFIIIIIFCSFCTNSNSSNGQRARAARCELLPGKGVCKNLSRLIFSYFNRRINKNMISG